VLKADSSSLGFKYLLTFVYRIHDFEVQMKKPAEKNRSATSNNINSSSASRSSTTSGSLLTSSSVPEEKVFMHGRIYIWVCVTLLYVIEVSVHF